MGQPHYAFRLYIHLRGPAFAKQPKIEIAKCLRKVAKQLESGDDQTFHPNKIHDAERVDCGRFYFSPETD